MSHPCARYACTTYSCSARSASACANFLGRFLARINSLGGDQVADTTTLGCCSTDVVCMVERTPVSNVVSVGGSVHYCGASHPLNILIHIWTKKSHDGVHWLSENCAAHQVDHEARTAVHSTRPRGVVREIPGWSHRMVFGSVVGPLVASVGPIHC